MTYIFINPVVDNMYIKDELDELLFNNGYKRVEVKTDWHKIVKEKYDKIMNQTELTVIDKRCPMAVDTIKPYMNEKEVLDHEIEPILIHCGIEIANREDLKGQKKVITTPCESLANQGNRLNLEDTTFISWKEFINDLDKEKKVQGKLLEDSPIPLGYFNSLEAKVSSISGKEVIENHFKNKLYDGHDIVEMLYCEGGCNSGDGVLINE